ncbi:secretin N-terminal domain-containing protein [Arsukibacterium indicum]|uniref:Type II/III secretion system secretin-like domain-containing protein n=1 Tax=Arsukibacterium indicum TaxID=2848612 RepID=A0ABS6MG41_9GAMM|nr:secretin N-terminal domain-containing protein [Arsukibacterium indicum]MBV2127783.1 hypothetical protein [Arsukibacterium indicum]
MKKISRLSICIAASLFIGGCATSHDDSYSVSSSRIASGDNYSSSDNNEAEQNEDPAAAKASGYQALKSLDVEQRTLSSQQDAALRLSDSNKISFAADKMPTEQFIHAVMGDMLKLNYVITDGISTLSQPQSLHLQQPVSSRELFLLTAQLLDSSNIAISLREDTYFIHPKTQNNASTVLGIGRAYQDVPQVVGQIMQIVPIKYGINISLERTLRELINAKITPDFEKNMLFITAERNEILRALDLIQLLDMPANRGRNVGILRLTYLSAEEFIEQVNRLLASEGIPADTGPNPKTNISMVPLDQIGAVALFASEPFYLDRVNYWAKQLDKPSEGAQKRYYIFHPRFARASDLGASIAPLIGQTVSSGNRQGNQSRDTASAFDGATDTGSRNQQQGMGTAGRQASVTVSNENMTMTVDERSNTIIFYTSGIQYQTLLPMIRRLDIMPKQILLEATIAEVTLTDELSMGLEFAIQNGNFGYGTKGAFGVQEFGGLSLSYLDVGKEFLANLRASKTNVNVLSNPSLVVRDGVSANINVGTDVPTVGSTSVNPGTETETTTVEYRKTGVRMTVTPTINAQGLVVLQIDQSISNTTDGGTLAGSPAIFERSLKTEVLAQSGQTIMLGGLISENTNKSTSKVPFFGDLPGIGALFRSQKDSVTKTELVILITPRVIDQPEHWQQIRHKLDTGLQNLKIIE